MPDTSLDPSPDARDLRALFDTAPPPDLAVDPAVVVAGGRRRVQRRRTVRGVAGSLAALAVVGGLTLGAGHWVDRQQAPVTASTDRGTAVAASAGPQAAPPLPKPTGSCTSSAASVPDDAGAPTPYAAARAVRLPRFDASGAWREGDRTATSARLYKDGVWVSTVRTAKGGWAVDGWTVCEGYTPPTLPPAVPETATAESSSIADGAGDRSVRLAGDPQWPDLTLVTDGREQPLTTDPTFRVPGDDVRAYRGAAGDTVLLVPLGQDRSVLPQVDPEGAWGAVEVEVGGLRYQVVSAGRGLRPRDVEAVYRTGPDGIVRSSTGETPLVARFQGSRDVTFTWFPRAGYALTGAGSVTGSGPWGGTSVWGADGPGGLASGGTQWTVGVLPAGAHAVTVDAAPGTTVRTQAVPGHVVVLAERRLTSADTPLPAGTLRWTDAAGVRWEKPENGEKVRLP